MSVQLTRDGATVVVPWHAGIASVIPHARELTHDGNRLLLIPNRETEARLCRNLGVHVPSPILTRYKWPGNRDPWEVQKTTAAMLSESPRAYVLSTMGTGKTKSCIYAADFLLNESRAKKVLIVAPLSTLTPVWEQELFATVPHRKWVVLHGSKPARLKALATDVDFYIINHHGLGVLGQALVKKKFDVVILDELAIFRRKTTELWKAAATVVGSVKFVWGLTGSPTPKAPTDAWAQVRMLTPARVPRTFTAFKDMTMRQITQFKAVERPEAVSIVHQAMQPSIRFTRDAIMELPPTSYVDRKVELNNEAKRAYKMLFDKMRALTSDGKSITAVNEGVLQNKLMQVACGYIYTDNKTVYELPNSNRLDALEEVIDECDRKLLVFVPYVHALTGIAAHLRSKGHSVETVSGSTPIGARNRIFAAFKNEANPRIIVAHPQCMSHGLTLTEANTVVWYAPTQSLEIYEQANARVTRPGQEVKTFIVHLFGTPVERMTYSRLKHRGKMQGLLLDLFSRQEVEF